MGWSEVFNLAEPDDIAWTVSLVDGLAATYRYTVIRGCCILGNHIPLPVFFHRLGVVCCGGLTFIKLALSNYCQLCAVAVHCHHLIGEWDGHSVNDCDHGRTVLGYCLAGSIVAVINVSHFVNSEHFFVAIIDGGYRADGSVAGLGVFQFRRVVIQHEFHSVRAFVKFAHVFHIEPVHTALGRAFAGEGQRGGGSYGECLGVV